MADELTSRVRLLLTLTQRLESYLRLIGNAADRAEARGRVEFEDLSAIAAVAADCEGWLRAQREAVLDALAETEETVAADDAAELRH